MKHLRRGVVLGACLAAILTAMGCGGGNGGAGSAVDVNTLDGQTGIPVGSSFRYTFAQAINTSSVTTASFFIVPRTPAAQVVKAAYDPAICDSAQALAASASCEGMNACTLDPAADLAEGSQYSICLSPSIQGYAGGAFEGFMATFTTAGALPTAAFQLIRLDGTKLDLTATPIPLRVAVEATFSVPMDPATVEAAMTVTDDAGTAVPGTFSWNADDTVATYTLSKNLKPQKTYHVKIAATASSKGAMAAVDETFKTMTQGDVNGDGYTDVVVGANATDVAGGLSDGSVYVFSGITIATSHGPGDAIATINSAEHDAQLGLAVSAAGDVNGDGYADVLASAPDANAGGTNRGIIYLFSGATLTGTVTTDNAAASFAGNEDNGHLGMAIAILQDITNDGCDEIGIASDQLNMGGTGRGGVYIFSGGTTISGPIVLGDAHATIRGGGNTDGLGSSIAGAGDVSGDGTPDVIVGASSVAGGGTNRGAAYVFSGATLAGPIDANPTTALAMITGISNHDHLGSSVAGPGDINGDGRDDVAVAAYGYNGGSNNGAAYFFDGATLSGTKTADDHFSRIAGKNSADFLGEGARSISGIGDFNADGHADIIVGADGVSGCAYSGEAYVFSGTALSGNLSAASAFATFTSPHNGDALGRSVSGGGDVDADGVPDFVIGSRNYPSGTGQGRVYVFSGAALSGSTTTADAFATLDGALAGDSFGGSVSAQ